MRKKINDTLLLEMLNQGKQQKDIAAYFKVSPVAVCKRLKRLQSGPEAVLERYDLTDQQKSFVVEKAKGKTNTQAALESYEVSSRKSAKAIGSQLMAEPIIRMALDELMETYLPQHYRIRKLRSHTDHADPIVSLKALDLSWKLDGSYAPEKHMEIKETGIEEILQRRHGLLLSERGLLRRRITLSVGRVENIDDIRRKLDSVEKDIEKVEEELMMRGGWSKVIDVTPEGN
jgi:predicted transcriptional regulator